MLPISEPIRAEVRPGHGVNSFYTGDAVQILDELAKEKAGTVQLIYMDPPFATGQRFSARLRVGAAEWKRGLGSLCVPAYDDLLSDDEYLAMMRGALESSKTLLKETGLIFIHLDWRMHARIRLLADEIFGCKNFINEIVWAYETGGRARRYFSRKHDIILLYAKCESFDLHVEDVAAVPEGGRANHMKKYVDEDGRVYRTIKSGGKTYRYYDDEPVPPSDVWTDVSRMQQRDPQRLGYDTQKPLSLMERIVKCASRPGDTVLDPFAGSGTTLEAAFRCGRNFVGVDLNPLCAEYARRRTKGAACVFFCPAGSGAPALDCEKVAGITDDTVYLNAFSVESPVPDAAIRGLDGVDGWALGEIRDQVFYTLSEEQRCFKTPDLSALLRAPAGTPCLGIRVSDIFGRRFFYSL